MIKRVFSTLMIILLMASNQVLFAAGNFFNIVGNGLPTFAIITLCLDGKAALSCQRYTVYNTNLVITTTIPNHVYPNVGINIDTPDYTSTGCTPTSNGYCLFSLSNTTSQAITITPIQQYSLGGTVAGLNGGTLYLQNNGTDIQSINTDGHFVFPTLMSTGTSYNVTVQTLPANQTCTVGNGTGIIENANVNNVSVTCSINSHSVGGTVSGLSGSLVLLNNGGDDQTLTNNGNFTFTTPIAEGSTYQVTVGTQPIGQTCTITNGVGTMGANDITNVLANCVTNNTSLSISEINLALATSGIARILTITNTGSATANNLLITYPTWPTGTSAISTCGSTLIAGGSCTITITPGNFSTSNCLSGLVPTPGIINVSASNVTTPLTSNIYILTYGCIYQEGYLFSIDDTTVTSASIGGKSISRINNASIRWYNGTFVATNATSLTDGAANTVAIRSAQQAGNYAAESCANYTVDSSGNSPCTTGTCYSGWYLPAICQMGPPNQAAGCTIGTPNLVTRLNFLISGCAGTKCLSGTYWSSSEWVSSRFSAWSQNYSPNGTPQATADKGSVYLVRCARDLTN